MTIRELRLTIRSCKNPQYRDWHNKVFEQSAGICSSCGGKAIHAHHVKGWWESPELRFEVANGRALCKSCHEETHGFKFGETFPERKERLCERRSQVSPRGIQGIGLKNILGELLYGRGENHTFTLSPEGLKKRNLILASIHI